MQCHIEGCVSVHGPAVRWASVPPLAAARRPDHSPAPRAAATCAPSIGTMSGLSRHDVLRRRDRPLPPAGAHCPGGEREKDRTYISPLSAANAAWDAVTFPRRWREDPATTSLPEAPLRPLPDRWCGRPGGDPHREYAGVPQPGHAEIRALSRPDDGGGRHPGISSPIPTTFRGRGLRRTCQDPGHLRPAGTHGMADPIPCTDHGATARAIRELPTGW